MREKVRGRNQFIQKPKRAPEHKNPLSNDEGSRGAADVGHDLATPKKETPPRGFSMLDFLNAVDTGAPFHSAFRLIQSREAHTLVPLLLSSCC